MMTSASASSSQKIVQTSFACFIATLLIISGKKKRKEQFLLHNEAWHTNDIWHHIVSHPRFLLIFTHSFHIACQFLIELGIYREGQWQHWVRRGEHQEKSFSSAVVDDLKRDFETWKEKQFDQKEKQSSFSMSCVPILRSDQSLLCFLMQTWGVYYCNLYYFCLHIPHLIGMLVYPPKLGSCLYY